MESLETFSPNQSLILITYVWNIQPSCQVVSKKWIIIVRFIVVGDSTPQFYSQHYFLSLHGINKSNVKYVTFQHD